MNTTVRLASACIVANLAFVAPVAAKPSTRDEFVDLVGPTVDKGEQILICPNPEAVSRVIHAGASRSPGSTARLERQADLEKCMTTAGPFKVVDATESQTTTDKRGSEEVVWFSLKVSRGSGPIRYGLYGWIP